MDIASVKLAILFSGLLLGIVFGFACQRSRFCFLGVISDIYVYGNPGRLTLYLLTLLTAVLGSQILIWHGFLNPIDSVYFNIKNQTVSCIFGGVLFGIGMTLCSGCTTSNLIKVGEGNIKSLLILILTGIVAISTMRGSLGVARVHILEDNFIIRKVNGFFELNDSLVSLVEPAFFLVLIIATFYILSKKSIDCKGNAIWGFIMGLCIVGAWFMSGNIGFIAEHPETLESKYLLTNSGRPESFSFIGPLVHSLEFFLYQSDSSKFISFGITILLGLLFGSFLSSFFQGRFKIEFFTTKSDFFYCAIGSSFMGIGGVTAFGCTLGHGLTGLSIGALNSIITVVSIIFGVTLGIRHLENKVA